MHERLMSIPFKITLPSPCMHAGDALGHPADDVVARPPRDFPLRVPGDVPRTERSDDAARQGTLRQSVEAAARGTSIIFLLEIERLFTAIRCGKVCTINLPFTANHCFG